MNPVPAPDPPPRQARIYWEDFAVGQVREFGRHTVTREEVIEFATRFDPQPFHLDDAAAAASLFGRLSASGWHTCAMAMRMMCDEYLLDAASLGSPGVEQLRWPHPVFPGDVLHMRMTVQATRRLASRAAVGVVRISSELLNQNGETVLAMESAGFFACRGPAATPDCAP